MPTGTRGSKAAEPKRGGAHRHGPVDMHQADTTLGLLRLTGPRLLQRGKLGAQIGEEKFALRDRGGGRDGARRESGDSSNEYERPRSFTNCLTNKPCIRTSNPGTRNLAQGGDGEI